MGREYATARLALTDADEHLKADHIIALYTVFYNWTKIHKTLRTTPAQAAGLTDRVMDMANIVALIEESEMLVPATQSM